MERKSPWITACLHLRVWQIKKIHIKFPQQAGDKKVYVNHKKAPSQCVSAETETEILLESHEDGTVSLKDMTEGTGGAYLYFWKGDTSKLHFDRYSSDDGTVSHGIMESGARCKK